MPAHTKCELLPDEIPISEAIANAADRMSPAKSAAIDYAELMDNIQVRIAEAIGRHGDALDTDAIAHKIQAKVTANQEAIAKRLLGYSESYGDPRIERDSVLGEAITDAAVVTITTRVDELVNSVFGNKRTADAMTKMMERTMRRHIKDTMSWEIERLIKDRTKAALTELAAAAERNVLREMGLLKEGTK